MHSAGSVLNPIYWWGTSSIPDSISLVVYCEPEQLETISGMKRPIVQKRAVRGIVSRLFFVCLCLFAGLFPGTSVLAQSGTDNTQASIGFVDIPYLINNAPQALEAERRLESEFAPREEELKLQRADLADVNERMKSQALELTETELAQLDREMRNLERRIKRDEQDFREELNIQKNNEFKKIRIIVLEAIAKFGQANSYDLIVSDGVLYANKQIDVTEKILESLRLEDQKLQSSN